MTVFDWHKWNAKVYYSQEEIEEALVSFGVKDKAIKEIHVIGTAQNFEQWSYTMTIRQKLAKAGLSHATINSGKYAGTEDVLIPHQVKICEPVVFVFDDYSTFEVMPINRDGLKMSVNQIPVNVHAGINNSNFDAALFFQKINGLRIDSVQKTNHSEVTDKNKRRGTTYQFALSGDCDGLGCYFYQEYDGWFEFGLTSKEKIYFAGPVVNAISNITFGEFIKAKKSINQITIVKGHDGGGYFWIMPVKHVEKTIENMDGIDEYQKEEISIDEDYVGEFLYYFLDKYFDADYPYGESRDESGLVCFEWNLEHNIYTYDTVKEMLADIGRYNALLKTDYKNEKLKGLKKHFSVYTFDQDVDNRDNKLTNKDKEKIIEENIGIATDFYDRFIKCMKAMMLNSPEYSLISFMGP